MSAVENLTAVGDLSNERLLIEAAQRDPRHFADLYEQNFERVYGFVSRRVPSREEAEDITAEVFQQALANLPRYQWRGIRFAAWLLRIAAHAVADRWQHKARRSEVPFDEDDESCHELACTAELDRHALLVKMVATLPDDQRYVVMRRFVDQRSMREIANEMQRSEGAVKQLQFRALESLRKLVKE